MPSEMPPGFEGLPIEEQLLISAYKDKPVMMQIYQATKIMELHTMMNNGTNRCKATHKDIDSRIMSLEDSRKKAKWWLGGAGAIIVLVKAYIIGKLVKIF